MTTATKPRTVRLVRNGDSLALVIREQKGRALQVDAYFLTRTPDGWKLGKHEGTSYTVRLAGKPSCSCKGHQRWGHQTVCRHIAALTKLVALGKLAAE